MKGRDLARRRKQTGVSQTELAQMLGTHQTVISRIENGHRPTQRDRAIMREMDDLLPELPPPGAGEPVTAEQREQVKRFIEAWAASEPENAPRQAVALEMLGRLKPT